MQTLGTTVKKFKPEESRPKELKSTKDKNLIPSRSEFTKPGKTSCTDKKREYLKKNQDRKNNTLATRDNANAVEGSEIKQNN